MSEGSFVRNVVVQIPKFDANPSPDSNPNSNPNPMPIRFGQMTFRTSELLPVRRLSVLIQRYNTVAIQVTFAYTTNEMEL